MSNKNVGVLVHIPQAKNIPYQPLLIKPIFSLLAHAEKQFFFSKLVFQCLFNVLRQPIPLHAAGADPGGGQHCLGHRQIFVY